MWVFSIRQIESHSCRFSASHNYGYNDSRLKNPFTKKKKKIHLPLSSLAPRSILPLSSWHWLLGMNKRAHVNRVFLIMCLLPKDSKQTVFATFGWVGKEQCPSYSLCFQDTKTGDWGWGMQSTLARGMGSKVEPRVDTGSPIPVSTSLLSLPNWDPRMGPPLLPSCIVPFKAEWMIEKK